jgi:hypothetical protein
MKNFSNLRFFGKNLNRFVVLTLALTFIGALFVFFSACKKDAVPASNLSDISEGQFKKFNWDAKESKFFELHRNNGVSSRDTTSPRGFYHPLLVESYNKLADENEKGSFAGRLTDVAGFPRWENALIYRDKNTNTNFVSIPLAFPGKNEVSSYISLLKQGDGEFVINGITRPDLLKTNQGDPRVKDSRARILAGFDKNLFGTVQQDVKDAVCYYGTRRDSIESNLAGGSTVPPTPPLQFCRYIPVYICIEDNKLKWGSYTGLLPIHLDHDMDGTPNQDDPQWIQAVVASGLSNQAFQNIFENFARDNWEQEYEGDYGDYDDFYEQLYDPNGGQDLSDLADMLAGIGQSIADAFDNFFHDIGHEIGDGWHDFWDWFGGIFHDGPPCPWGGLTSVTDREVTCGTIYLLACGGEEGTQEWWDKMIEQMEGYTPPDGYTDLRDYTAKYIADNNLEGLIEHWELVDILDGTTVNTACYPSDFGGFSDCADDKMLQFVVGTLDFYNVVQLEQDQVYLLDNDKELLAVIASFVHNNLSNSLHLVDDIINLYKQANLSPQELSWLCQLSNFDVLSHIIEVKNNNNFEDPESVNIAASAYVKLHIAHPDFESLEDEMAVWPTWMWDIAGEVLVEVAGKMVKKHLGITMGEDVKEAIKSCGSGDALMCVANVVDVLRKFFPALKAIDLVLDITENSVAAKRIFTALESLQGIGEQALKRAYGIFAKLPVSILDVANPYLYLKYIDDIKIPNLGGSFATKNNYSPKFKSQFPELGGKIGPVHHAVPQDVLTRYPNLGITQDQMHSFENLRGIPSNGTLDHQTLTNYWQAFYNSNPNASVDDLLEYTKFIDDEFGHLFMPPIR